LTLDVRPVRPCQPRQRWIGGWTGDWTAVGWGANELCERCAGKREISHIFNPKTIHFIAIVRDTHRH
jgi:hypothetical protein